MTMFKQESEKDSKMDESEDLFPPSGDEAPI